MHFPDPMKKAMLQNIVNDVDVFADIKRLEELDIAKGRKAVAYNDYTSLVQRVATNYDEKREASTKTRGFLGHYLSIILFHQRTMKTLRHMTTIHTKILKIDSDLSKSTKCNSVPDHIRSIQVSNVMPGRV
mgnify:CR=1 FL=1